MNNTLSWKYPYKYHQNLKLWVICDDNYLPALTWCLIGFQTVGILKFLTQLLVSKWILQMASFSPLLSKCKCHQGCLRYCFEGESDSHTRREKQNRTKAMKTKKSIHLATLLFVLASCVVCFCSAGFLAGLFLWPQIRPDPRHPRPQPRVTSVNQVPSCTGRPSTCICTT